MLFWQAVEQFREFLRTQGHSGPLVWIVPADVVFWFGELLIRPTIDTETHAEQLFNRAFQRGFGVAIEGIAKLDHGICCFVFAPDDAADAADNFVTPPLTMKVRQDLKMAREPGFVLWWLARRVAETRTVSRIAVLRPRLGSTWRDGECVVAPDGYWHIGSVATKPERSGSVSEIVREQRS